MFNEDYVEEQKRKKLLGSDDEDEYPSHKSVEQLLGKKISLSVIDENTPLKKEPSQREKDNFRFFQQCRSGQEQRERREQRNFDMANRKAKKEKQVQQEENPGCFSVLKDCFLA